MPKKPKKRTAGKRSARKLTSGKPKYVCFDCGTEVVMDSCGVDFRRLVCCGRTMKKKQTKKKK